MNGKISKPIVMVISVLFIGATIAAQKTKTIDVPVTRITGTMYVDRAAGFKGTFNNTVIMDGKLELINKAIIGTYTSIEFSTVDFTKLVGSWSVAYTTDSNTVEVEYKIKNSNGIWSGWLSYQQWGFNRANYPVDTTMGNAKIHIDEIIPIDGTANAFRYRVILRRSSSTAISPKVKAISASLYQPSNGQTFDISSIPNSKIYPIDALKQQDVKIGIDDARYIGSLVCSATAVTMLLQYKGVTDFDGEVPPQRYVAKIVRDRTNDIYGNWAYCASTLGSWDTTAFIGYACHMYSMNEIAYHLAKVGPIVISVYGTIAGTGTDGKGDIHYTTDGHLIVVRGYEKSGNLVTKFYINDPNKGRTYFMTPEQLSTCTSSKITYVIE